MVFVSGLIAGPDTGIRMLVKGDIIITRVGTLARVSYLNAPFLGNCLPRLLGLTIGEYCDGLVDAGLSRVPPVDTEPKRPIYHGSPETHLAHLESTRCAKANGRKSSYLHYTNSVPP